MKVGQLYRLEGENLPLEDFDNILFVVSDPIGKLYLLDNMGFWAFTLKDINEKGWKLKKICDNLDEFYEVDSRGTFSLYDPKDRLCIFDYKINKYRYLVRRHANKSKSIILEKLENNIKALNAEIEELKTVLNKFDEVKLKIESGELDPNAVTVFDKSIVILE